MNNWRFSAEMTVYIPEDGQKDIYVASSEKKSYQAAVTKSINCGGYKSLGVSDCKLEAIRFVKDLREKMALRLEVKSKHLPEPSEWYTLRNFDITTLGDILTQVEGIKGEYNQEFEVAFNTTDPLKVTVMTQGMDSYKKCLTEMARRLSCDLGTKTKKWKVGHKYETESQTFIYLGTVSSRKNINTRSLFLKDIDVVDAILYVTELLPNEKTVGDVLSGRCFDSVAEDGIKILYKLKPAVDAGEVLKSDCNSYDDYALGLFERTSDKFKTTTTFGRETYSNIKDQLDVLSLQSPGTFEYSDEASEAVEKLLKTWGWEVLITNWESRGNYYNIDINESHDEIITAFSNLISISIRDENVLSVDYYRDLFRKMNINLKGICDELLDIWNMERPTLKTDFDSYTRNLEYIKAKHIGHYINLKTYSSSYYNQDNKKIESYFETGKSNNLVEIIQLLANYSKSNYGSGVDTYKIFNVGTVKNPRSYVRIEMSLKNILDFAKSEMKLSDDLKNEIMLNNVTSVIIESDNEKEIV